MILKTTAERTEILKNCLLREFSLSSTLLKRLKYANAIRVDGVCVHVDHLLTPGACVTLDLDAAEPACAVPPEPGALRVIYEDEALLAVCKPRGMLTHPSHARTNGTLLGRVLAHTPFAHTVNRLDRDTTGIVLFAKNAYAQERTVLLEKGYTAVALGCFDPPCGTVDAPIGRLREQDMERGIGSGKAAVTHYRAAAAFSLMGSDCTLTELRPETGRTHQLRVHCASLGHPLLGDRLYGTPESIALSDALGIPGQLLHAGFLRFLHPLTAACITLSCPDDFSVFIQHPDPAEAVDLDHRDEALEDLVALEADENDDRRQVKDEG